MKFCRFRRLRIRFSVALWILQARILSLGALRHGSEVCFEFEEGVHWLIRVNVKFSHVLISYEFDEEVDSAVLVGFAE